MAQIVVRQLDDDVLEALKSSAARNNRSTEAEVRAILADAVGRSPHADSGNAGRKRFSDFVGIAAKRSTQDEIDAYVRSLRGEWGG